jgi:hypothetical protein
MHREREKSFLSEMTSFSAPKHAHRRRTSVLLQPFY